MSKAPETFDKKAKEACEYNAGLMKLERKSRGLTQQEMADEIGVNLSYIGNIENNNVKIPLFIVQEYSRILGVPASRFSTSKKDSLPEDKDLLSEYHKLPDRLKAYVYELIRELGS